MSRTFIYFAAFTGMGTIFALTMILAARRPRRAVSQPGATLPSGRRRTDR